MTSRMDGELVRSMTRRSMPMDDPDAARLLGGFNTRGETFVHATSLLEATFWLAFASMMGCPP